MNAGGIVLAVVGVWVLCQVLGGDALVRLGIVQGATTDLGPGTFQKHTKGAN